MHEYSIVQALLNQCEENAKKHNATQIKKVVLKIGVLSGVEPHLLEIAFETFKEGTICHDAILEMNIQDIIIYCKDCKQESKVDDFALACPKCKSINVSVIDGEDMYLMSLEMV
jgi:hydrogenase nickel incorporation protein HypA/HybF